MAMARSVLREHAGALHVLFDECTDADIAGGSTRYMGTDELLSFGQRFDLCPALLTRVDILRLSTEALQGQGGDGGHRRGGGSGAATGALDFAAFVRFLERCALHVFCGAEWDARCPSSGTRLQLLLFYIDQGSKRFRGNGAALLKAGFADLGMGAGGATGGAAGASGAGAAAAGAGPAAGFA
eukprot:g2986.t1